MPKQSKRKSLKRKSLKRKSQRKSIKRKSLRKRSFRRRSLRGGAAGAGAGPMTDQEREDIEKLNLVMEARWRWRELEAAKTELARMLAASGTGILWLDEADEALWWFKHYEDAGYEIEDLIKEQPFLLSLKARDARIKIRSLIMKYRSIIPTLSLNYQGPKIDK